MSLIVVLLGLWLGVLPCQDSKPAPAPSEELVSTACRALEQAFAAESTSDEAERAVREASRVVHPKVIALLDSKGLRHRDTKLRTTVIEALARMDHPDALAALHAALKRDKKELQEAPPLHAALLRAIARHGSPTSIPLLTEDLFQSPDRGVITARILGLGNIRTKAAVEELIQIMRSAPRPRVGDFMGEFRLSLVALTGEDKGTDQELWINWYGDHKNSLEIAKQRGVLPPALERRWNQYWGLGERRGPPGKKGPRDGRER